MKLLQTTRLHYMYDTNCLESDADFFYSSFMQYPFLGKAWTILHRKNFANCT